jgi:hypothetical protein
MFPGEIYRAPRNWAEQAYRTLYDFNELGKGGTSPRGSCRRFAGGLRAAFRPSRTSL